ncbi:MAG: hypothetical protein DMF24_04365 [Verrucomicrobia bacterium]|nr:MAG: hypothetical protein DMF24_04365 [Verrucomicrobiota bacterium]
MRKVNTTKMAELTWSSPKGKFIGAGKEISEALGRKPESTDLNERQILTFRVTDQSGVSCLGGWKDVWRKFVVVEGHVPSGPPIYQVEGRALQINLSGDMCDAYDIIDGVLTGTEFRRERRIFGLGGGEVVGTVRGSLCSDERI